MWQRWGRKKAHPAGSTLLKPSTHWGTTLAPLASAAFILGSQVKSTDEIALLDSVSRTQYYATEAAAVQIPFLVLAAALLLLAALASRFPIKHQRLETAAQSGSSKALLQHRHLVLGTLAIFCYVGAEVTIGSYLVNYFLSLDIVALVQANPAMHTIAAFLSGDDPSSLTAERLAGTFVFFYWGGAMIGRFAGIALLRLHNPSHVLAVYGVLCGTLLVCTMALTGLFAVWSVLAIGLFNSIMFPTIFTLAIRGTGEKSAQASGLVCMAIVGGAIVPPLYGAVADWLTLKLAFFVPLACYFYIVYYGLHGSVLKRVEHSS